MAAVSAFLIILTCIPSANSADVIATDPVQIMQKLKPTSGARGMLFVENISAGVSIGWIRYSHIPTFNSNGSIDQADYWNWKKCSNWKDSQCPIKTGYTVEGKVILGTCMNSAEIGCIENFKIFNSFGAGKKLTYVGKAFSAAVDTPEEPSLDIPRSSSPPLYKDEDGNYFIVRAGIWISVANLSNPSFKLDVDITPVLKTTDASLTAPKVENNIEPRTGLGNVWVVPSPPECISVDVGTCYKAKVADSEYKYSVAVRVPRAVSGWLRGRVSNANFDVQLLNEKSQLITVTAQPVKMPIAGGWVSYPELPAGFIDSIWPSGGYDPNPSSSYFLIGDPSQGDQGMREYVAWSPYLKEKALTTVANWSFGTNVSGSDQSCLREAGEISGFVASNASVYSSKPPEWDAAASTLTYKVAAPHYDENGNENSGSYTLAMPLKSIKCLYGQSDLPPSATVSVAYGNEVTNIATVSLQSDSGWVFFSANNFHYSSPKIVVKFNSSGSTAPLTPSPTKNPSPTPSQSSTPKAEPTPIASQPAVPKPQASAAKTTIWCAKGYAKRKVTAVKPACPKGYKKIADPFRG
jgi:hypothetical protein